MSNWDADILLAGIVRQLESDGLVSAEETYSVLSNLMPNVIWLKEKQRDD